jgi:hypothetical protein
MMMDGMRVGMMVWGIFSFLLGLALILLLVVIGVAAVNGCGAGIYPLSLGIEKMRWRFSKNGMAKARSARMNLKR